MATGDGERLRPRFEQLLTPFPGRFVEITAIVIRDVTVRAKRRVIIEHRTGARETFESQEKTRESTIKCERCSKRDRGTRGLC